MGLLILKAITTNDFERQSISHCHDNCTDLEPFNFKSPVLGTSCYSLDTNSLTATGNGISKDKTRVISPQ